MAKSEIALAILVWTLATAFSAFLYGKSTQADIDAAQANAQTVSALTTIISNSATLAADAAKASQAMRRLVAERSKADQQSTQELKDALIKTAGNRVDCRFDAGVMQQLSAARERAADAATGGLRHAVPSTESTNGQQR